MREHVFPPIFNAIPKITPKGLSTGYWLKPKLLLQEWRQATKWEKVARSLQRKLKDNDAVLVPADKNVGLILCHTDWYHELNLQALRNTNSFSFISKEEHDKVKATTLSILRSPPMLYTHKKVAQYNKYKTIFYRKKTLLYGENWMHRKEKNMSAYGLCKLHKTPVKNRLIVSYKNRWLSGLDSLILEDLQCLMLAIRNKSFPLIITEGTDELIYSFLHGTRQNGIQYDNELWASLDGPSSIHTGDVTELYTNLEHDQIRSTLEFWMRKTLLPISVTMMSRINLFLNSLVFTYGDQYFVKQTKGIPMGAKCSPILANLVLAKIEYEVALKHPDLTLCCRRYLDDLLVINGSATSYTPFFEILREKYAEIGLVLVKTNTNKEEAVFLDTVVSFQSNVLEFDLYRKPEQMNTHIPYGSNHPICMLRGVVFGHMYRIKSRCSTPDRQSKHIVKLIDEFVDRGYKKDLIEEWLKHDSISQYDTIISEKIKDGLTGSSIRSAKQIRNTLGLTQRNTFGNGGMVVVDFSSGCTPRIDKGVSTSKRFCHQFWPLRKVLVNSNFSLPEKYKQ